MKKVSCFAVPFAFLFGVLGILSSAYGSASDGKGSYYWTGAVNSNFEEPGNWVFDSPTGPVCSVPPIKNDFQATAFFTDATSPASKVVALPSNREIYRFVFQSSGWSFSGGTPTMKEMRATDGEGMIATFAQQVTIKGTAEVACLAGGELLFTGGINQDSSIMKVSGGGTISIKHNNNWNRNRLYEISQDTLVRVDYTSPFGSTPGKHVSLKSAGARVQYKGTVASAEAKFGVSAEGANGLVNGFDPQNYGLLAKDIGEGYVEVCLSYLGAPKIESASFAVVDDECVVSVTLDGPEADLYAVADDGVNEPFEIFLGTGSLEETLTGLVANTTYSLTVKASNEVDCVSQNMGILYTGVPELSLGADAFEEGLVSGFIQVSRSSASPYPLVVAYTCEGTGAGQTYVAPSGIVTIPAGEESVNVELEPLADTSVSDDVPLLFALSTGTYWRVGALPVTLFVRNASDYPADKNVWIATSESDGLASTAENWSRGRVPNSTDDILVDGLYSNESMAWDAGVNGLSDTVASWTQRNYAGTNTVHTTYEGAFQTLTILGDCTLSSGVWTHLANSSAQTYRLNVWVGGDFLLGAEATLSAYRKGYSAGKFPEGGAVGIHAGGRDSLRCVSGSVTQPEDIGAGGVPWNSYLPGGGAIKVVVAGDAVVDGLMDATAGQNASSWGDMMCGAPGSIFLQAASVSGAGSLDVSAPVYNAENNTPSGGRIGVVLTEASELGLPTSQLKALGTLGRNRSSSGAGTVFVKTATEPYGTLYVRNRLREIRGTYGIMHPDCYGTTQIPVGETWTLDRIVFEQAGILSIPEGATLSLPNGFASLTGTSKTAGLLMLGGTIDAGREDPHVLQGNWVFHAEVPYTFDRDTIVRQGAGIGVLRLYNNKESVHQSTVTVDGDLTVESDGYLYAVESGFSDTSGDHMVSWLGAPFSHGGAPAIVSRDPASVYGSVLNPVLPGTIGAFDDTATQSVGGGALILMVRGHLVLDGSALSIGGPDSGSYSPGGTGGSLNITAGSLSGNGSICANGHNCEQNVSKILDGQESRVKERNVIIPSGGGRIAVRLTTPNAVFPEGFVSRITAYGGVFTTSQTGIDSATNSMSSAGTIYVQDGTRREGAGTVYIRNGSRAYNRSSYTPFPSTTYGGETDCFRAASLAIGELSKVALTRPTQMEELVMDEGTSMDLCGRVLTVKRATVGGVRLRQASYAASDLPGYLSDSSEEGSGRLLVAGDCTLLLLR